MSKQLPKQIRNILSSWLMAVTLEYLLVEKGAGSLTGLEGIAGMSGIRVICVSIVLVVLWNLLPKYWPSGKTRRWVMVCAFAVYAMCAVIRSFTWPFFAGCLLILVVFGIYAVFGWEKRLPEPLPSGKERRIWPILTGIAALAFFCLVSGWTVARVRSFSTPTFDFGIFSQMFYNMKRTGLPITTVERDGALSHFAVHMSPVYYLLLPMYCLVPRPETLQVLQAAILASAVIPLWKLGKLHGMHPGLRMTVCLLLLLYPAYAGGASYDLHENCFLTPLILWLFYGIDRRSGPITAVFTLLVLTVKEDAAVYVAVIGLYVLLRSCLYGEKWGIWAGSIMTIGAIGWFLGVTAYLTGSGDGIMSYRYRNFMYDGSDSLASVIKAVLLCPMKAVFECLDAEKMAFIGLTLLPLLFLPLATRRYERFVLLIPYILMNLMSDYQYQHDIMFQYTFGATACLFYLAVVNLVDWKVPWHRIAAVNLALCISFGCFYEVILPVAGKYISYCIQYGGHYDSQRAMLDTVPEDVSVAATTFYTTYLSNCEILYDIRYGSTEHILSCEYIVLKVTDAGAFKRYEVEGKQGKENFVELLLDNGYILESELQGVLEIYRQK